MRASLITTLAASGFANGAYWMEKIAHQGIAAYHEDPNYKVFRNVKDFGAVGDGETDDTAAINLAISSGVRCAPFVCKQSTTSPATVYFPPGTYLINGSIIDYYYTSLIGDPTNLPVIKAAPNFDPTRNFGLIDGNPYGANGLAWIPVNVFFRQIANFIIDTTAMPTTAAATGIHWPSSQATSLTNIVFKLAEGADSEHQGIFMEEGSGGLLNDLTFYGGKLGANFGNQQYTARNLKFYNAQVAINQLWDWGWTYKSLYIENCGVGIQMADNNTASVTILDSEFKNVTTAISTIRIPGGTFTPAAGRVVLYNVIFDDVEEILVGPQGAIIPGGGSSQEFVHAGFALGNVYDPLGPEDAATNEPSLFPPPPPSLLGPDGKKYYERSKPQYEEVPVGNFVSARSSGATGDGIADDTAALNKLFRDTARNGKIAFVDAGTYFVTDTVFIPAGARIVGEGLASNVIGGGPNFSNRGQPRAVIQVAKPGEVGTIEWSNMVVATRGAAPGAIVVQYNLNSPLGTEPAGMWDVHIRVGGFAGTEQLIEQCDNTRPWQDVVEQCTASWMSMHITKSASGLFMENCWVWVADHDIEDPNYARTHIFSGRGVYVESKTGRLWFSASASEHHVLYQYLFHSTRDIYMGQIQTETPYYQPSPPAPIPFTPFPAYHDPDFALDCANSAPNATAPCEMSWGLRIHNSQNVLIYGAGLYSFFNNYSTSCSDRGNGGRCQQRIFEITDKKCGAPSANINVYNLNIVGTRAMVTRQGETIASFDDNNAGFTAGLAVYKHDDEGIAV
ncbi:Glucan 1,3-beta-glucosidase [Paramyrothecium foliicola]|nr:Glucan 1,3-beta-glucosidase [Paramyrothecium foliicola]